MRTDKTHVQVYRQSQLKFISAPRVLILALGLFLASLTVWAQPTASSHADRAAQAHGDAWQKGTVKSWVAHGTVTLYRYGEGYRQTQDTYPVVLIYKSGAGSKGDQFQRLILKMPDNPASAGLYAGANQPGGILIREGTDGSAPWHSAGSGSSPASGRAQRLVESNTERSLEALFNFRARGKNLSDVTAGIAGQRPPGNPTPGSSGDSRFAVPSFEAAKNKRVIEVSDPPAGGGGAGASKGQKTRYYIDDLSSLVTRMEFDYGTGTDALSNQPVTLTEAYEFSNYRDVSIVSMDPLTLAPPVFPSGVNPTVKFPFMIERYIDGKKVESLVFSQVALNRNLSPENFRR